MNPVEQYRTLVVASGLEWYARYGFPINRSYTPKNMLRAAESILPGCKFKRSKEGYLMAAQALRDAVRETNHG